MAASTSSWLKALALCLACACLNAAADTVHLKNGKSLRGEIVAEDDDSITLRVPYGQVKIARKDIDFVERQNSEEYAIELSQDLMAGEKYDLAIQELERAHKEVPKSENLRGALIEAYETFGKHLLEVRRFEEAGRVFRKLSELDPGARIGREGLEAVEGQQDALKQLLAKGRQEAAAGRLDEAIATFEDAMAFSAESRALAARDFALALARRAEAQYRHEAFDAAQRDLERAFAAEPELANPLENLYTAAALRGILEHYHQGRLAEARQRLGRVLAFAPANAISLYIAGRLEETLRNTEGAADFYARGLGTRALNVTPGLVTELRGKLEEQLKIPGAGQALPFDVAPVDQEVYAKAKAGPFEIHQTERFTILHHNQQLADEVGEILEAHLPRIQSALGLSATWKGKPAVHLHPTQEAYTLATGQPEWTGGVSKFAHTKAGLERMEIHSWQTSPRLFKSVLPHELTHLVVNQNLPSYQALPRALHEGFAVLLEPPFRHAYFQNFVRLRLKSKEFLPLEDLLAAKDYPRDPEFFYAEGFSLIAFLVDTCGAEKALRLIGDAGKEQSAERRLLDITGAHSLKELEQDWKEWMVKGK